MPNEKLSPERAIRLLRAKAGELEHKVLLATELQEEQQGQAYIAATEFKYLVADIALVATLLADFMERIEDEDGELMQALESREKSFMEGFNEGRPADG